MRLLRTQWPIFSLTVISIVICLANYSPGTFLSGWDTLHPEFNFPLAFSRAIFGVFRPEQGLGAVAGHSHMADLPHIIFLALLSSVVPLPLLRYIFIFLCYLLGTVGMYLFLSHLLPKKGACFVGALFYMLNIGTVQNFYVPFEMFAVHFASLPWLFLLATDYLFTKRQSSLPLFVLTAILSSPMAFAATLWYVTYGIVGIYLISLEILLKIPAGGAAGDPARVPALNASEGSHRSGTGLKGGRLLDKRKRSRQDPQLFTSSFTLLALMLLVNLYWVLPNIYFVMYHGQAVTQAATNQLFSEEAFLYNKAFGNFTNIALLKTFYFDWSAYANHTFTKLMQPWIRYEVNPLITFLEFVFFAFAIIGLVAAIMRRKKVIMSLLPALIMCLIFLINDNLPFHVYALFQKIPLFQEAFRFPDDKILGIYTFIYSIFFAYGIFVLSNFLKQRILHATYYILLTTLLLVASFPVFHGNLISPEMRVRIPQEYFQLFSFMNSMPDGRIATFPINSLWGWEYYGWSFDGVYSEQSRTAQDASNNSFQGSGFLPFGLKQATMDRDFDRWNSGNENYYREMSYAVYTQNPTLLLSVLKKYNISYALLDTSILAVGDRKSALWYTPTEQLFSRLGFTPKKFGGHLFLYSFTSSPIITASTTLPPIASQPEIDYIDTSFALHGDYRDSAAQKKGNFLAINHLGLLNDVSQQEIAKLPTPFAYAHLFEPTFLETASMTNAQNDCTSNPFFFQISPLVWRKEIYFGYIRYIAQDGPLCDHISFPYPLATGNYLVQITARNIQGLSLRVCVSDPSTGKCIVYTKLPASQAFTTTSLFLPAFSGNKRFSVNINTIGIPGTTSINDVKNISIKALPASTHISSIPIATLEKRSTVLQNNAVSIRSNYTEIDIKPSNKPISFLTFFSAYEPGWQLYLVNDRQSPVVSLLPFFFGKAVGKHVEVDNWANGWILSTDQQPSRTDYYILVFLPQYLEYFGFLVGGITLCALFIASFHRHFVSNA